MRFCFSNKIGLLIMFLAILALVIGVLALLDMALSRLPKKLNCRLLRQGFNDFWQKLRIHRLEPLLDRRPRFAGSRFHRPQNFGLRYALSEGTVVGSLWPAHAPCRWRLET
jgi:hypothetical protein